MIRPLKVGWYGGSFDPPHLGHQAVVLHALETLDLDSLLIAPAYKHAEGKVLAPYNARVEMVHHMLGKVNDARAHASMDEWHAYKNGLSPKGLTVDTLAYVRSTYVEAGFDPTIFMIVGSDVSDSLPRWEGYERLKPELDAGRIVVQVVPRISGHSSTDARKLLRREHYNQARRLLPKRVFDYIRTTGIYIHDEHGRGSPEYGPDDPDCPCRLTNGLRQQCARSGCGFCVAAISPRDSDAL